MKTNKNSGFLCSLRLNRRNQHPMNANEEAKLDRCRYLSLVEFNEMKNRAEIT